MRKLKINFGWVIAIVLSTIPIVLWFFASKANPPFNNIQNTIVSLGEIFGLVGAVMLVLNFILATRLPFIEKLFNGLNGVYKKHNFFGQLALILLVFHPLFLIPRYASNFQEAASFLFFSNIWARNFGIISLWIIIILIILTLYLRPKYHIWKATHKFFGAALLFGVLHIFLIPGYIMNSILLKSYVLIMVILGIISFLYRSIFGKYLIKTHQYVIDDIHYLNREIVEIILKPKDKKLLFSPGQFIFISFNQKNLSESHPFSISSGPDEDLLRITIKNLGDYTKSLKEKLQLGTEAKIEGPYGNFSYQKTQSNNQVWIAGGVGITPFVSFANDMISKRNKEIRVTLFYCVKNIEEAIYLKFFKEIEKMLNNFSIVPFFSEKSGHISTEYIRKQVVDFDNSSFFICASPRMIREISDDLVDNEIRKDKIYSEEFNF